MVGLAKHGLCSGVLLCYSECWLAYACELAAFHTRVTPTNSCCYLMELTWPGCNSHKRCDPLSVPSEVIPILPLRMSQTC